MGSEVLTRPRAEMGSSNDHNGGSVTPDFQWEVKYNGGGVGREGWMMTWGGGPIASSFDQDKQHHLAKFLWRLAHSVCAV